MSQDSHDPHSLLMLLRIKRGGYKILIGFYCVIIALSCLINVTVSSVHIGNFDIKLIILR